MKHYFAIFVWLVHLMVGRVISAEEQTQIVFSGSSTYKFALPINWTTNNKYTLIVSIPSGYRSIESQSQILRENSPIIEFIPKAEKDYAWTEIITINKYLGKGYSVASLSKYLKNAVSKISKGKLWKDTFSKETSFERASLGMSYNSEGTHEVIEVEYYAGPYDSVGVQYTIRPRPGQSDAEVIQKIENFFITNVQITSDKVFSELFDPQEP